MLNIFNKINTGLKIILLFRNWPNVLLGCVGLRHNEFYTLRNGVKYTLASNIDWIPILEIWSNRVYNPSGQEVETGYIIVDIGAHIGVFSIFVAHQSADVRVISYEPHPYNFQLLRENVKLNDLSNIEPIPLAVNTKSGKGRLFINQIDLGHSLVKTQDNYIEVDCVTLEEILSRIGRCDFMKMDCEGAEYDILFTTPHEYLKKINKMSVECHDNYDGYVRSDFNVYKLKNFLERLGFRVEIAMKGKKQEIYLYARKIS